MSPTRSALLTSLALAAATSCGTALAATDPDALLSFTQAHPMLPRAADRPMVQVFADGRVTVFRDRLRRLPGEHVFTLDDAALERLLALAGLGLSTGAVTANSAAEAPPQEAAPGLSVSTIADPTTSLIGIASTLGQSAFAPPPAPGADVSNVAVSNEEAGLVTFVLEQTSASEAAAAATDPEAPAFEPVLEPARDPSGDADGSPPGGTISLGESEAAPSIDPLRTLEAALIELYLLPDVAAEAGR